MCTCRTVDQLNRPCHVLYLQTGSSRLRLDVFLWSNFQRTVGNCTKLFSWHECTLIVKMRPSVEFKQELDRFSLFTFWMALSLTIGATMVLKILMHLTGGEVGEGQPLGSQRPTLLQSLHSQVWQLPFFARLVVIFFTSHVLHLRKSFWCVGILLVVRPWIRFLVERSSRFQLTYLDFLPALTRLKTGPSTSFVVGFLLSRSLTALISQFQRRPFLLTFAFNNLFSPTVPFGLRSDSFMFNQSSLPGSAQVQFPTSKRQSRHFTVSAPL